MPDEPKNQSASDQSAENQASHPPEQPSAPRQRRTRGGDTRAAAAQNGKRVGRPPDLAKKAITDAKKLTHEKQEAAVQQAIAEADALGHDMSQTNMSPANAVTVSQSAAVLEARIAIHATTVADRLLEAANGLTVQEMTKDGPRIYTQPPNVPALIYLGNRIAGTPISKSDLLDLVEKIKTGHPAQDDLPTRDEMLAEALSLLLDKFMERMAILAGAQNTARPPAAPPPLLTGVASRASEVDPDA